MKKYLKRKSYKERTQPEARKRLGLLEKHRDYVERAQKYHEHTAELEKLRREAEERNPQEFHFSMEHERTKGGIPISFEKKQSAEEEIALKGKDLSFLNCRIRQETRNAEKLRAELHLLGWPAKNQHTIFVDRASEVQKFDESEYFETPKELMERRFNRPRRHQMKEQVMPVGAAETDEAHLKDLNEQRVRRYEELNSKVETLRTLKTLANELWLKKELAKGEEHKKEKMPDGRTVIKWKKVRK